MVQMQYFIVDVVLDQLFIVVIRLRLRWLLNVITTLIRHSNEAKASTKPTSNFIKVAKVVYKRPLHQELKAKPSQA